jgi:NAD(P)-dependent dehydrogenase (short-subunit alcohol dehydrogenase family)
MSSQVVLITGALTGIGRATAFAFAKAGSAVVVSGRHDDKGEALVRELRSLGVEADFIRADVRREEDVRALVDRTVTRLPPRCRSQQCRHGRQAGAGDRADHRELRRDV